MRGRLHWTAALRRYLTLLMPSARPWDRNRPRKFVCQGEIILAMVDGQGGRPGWMATTDGQGSFEIMRRAAVSKADTVALLAVLSW